uniref:Uncharacterized protein n=1 Tax=Anguilla anguilla TaxID=7936 RepID=A0A0E9QDQ4_ANGAN
MLGHQLEQRERSKVTVCLISIECATHFHPVRRK